MGVGSTVPVRHSPPLRFKKLARGIDHDPVVWPTVNSKEPQAMKRRSNRIRNDRAFLEQLCTDFQDARLRPGGDGLAAESCTVKLKDSRFSVTTKQRSFPHPLNYEPEMWPTIKHVLHELVKPETKYRLAGLGLSSLTAASPGLYDQRRDKALKAWML